MAVSFPCTILFLIGIITLSLTIKGRLPWSRLHAFLFLGLAVGLPGFVYCFETMAAYELLIENELYCSRFLFQLKRRLLKK